MPNRQWEHEVESEIPEGLIPDGPALDVPRGSLQELDALMAEAVHILDRIGGVISIGAVREEIAPGLWETDRFVFKWESYAPGRRHRGSSENGTGSQVQADPEREPEAEAEPEPEPETPAEPPLPTEPPKPKATLDPDVAPADETPPDRAEMAQVFGA